MSLPLVDVVVVGFLVMCMVLAVGMMCVQEQLSEVLKVVRQIDRSNKEIDRSKEEEQEAVFIKLREAISEMWICRYCSEYAYWHIELGGERVDVCAKHVVEMAESVGGSLREQAVAQGLIKEQEQ